MNRRQFKRLITRHRALPPLEQYTPFWMTEDRDGRVTIVATRTRTKLRISAAECRHLAAFLALPDPPPNAHESQRRVCIEAPPVPARDARCVARRRSKWGSA